MPDPHKKKHPDAHGDHPANAKHGHDGHAEEHHEFDAVDHALDQTWFYINTRGDWVWNPSTSKDPMKLGNAAIGYPQDVQTVGPVPLIFSKGMRDVTVVAILLAVVAIWVTQRVLKNMKEDRAPKGRLANFMEACVQFVRDQIVMPVGGKHVAPYTPLFLTYFLFILLANFAGMVPYFFKGPTAMIMNTAALGGSVFIVLTALGMAVQGPVHYMQNLVPHGVPIFLVPLLWVIEFMGPVIKCGVLCVRLFANMVAGHLVLGSLLGLAIVGEAGLSGAAVGIFFGIPLAFGFMLLEILVCLIQAFVFTMLAVVFVSAAVHPEH